MKIGIDGRLIDETGVGRYIRNLIEQLEKQDPKNRYVVFLRKKSFNGFVLPNNRWEKRIADVPWHSFREQLVMPWIYLREHLDLVHIPYFNVPIFYPGKFIVTIHDLTILHFDTGKATTLPWLFYKLRRLGYWLALTIGLKSASKILAVSQTTKREIIDHFDINPEKIVVTYEGVDKKIQNSKFKIQNEKRAVKNPYFLYVGNAYPHKNLETLLKAFKGLSALSTQLSAQAKLVLVGEDDFFYRKLKEEVKRLELKDKVIFGGPADDRQLSSLYSGAIALVLPSLMEGFGLPALEALTLGCPVICSDIPVFHEILERKVAYFNPSDVTDLTDKLKAALSARLPKPTVGNLGRFSWKRMTEQVLEIYKSSVPNDSFQI